MTKSSKYILCSLALILAAIVILANFGLLELGKHVIISCATSDFGLPMPCPEPFVSPRGTFCYGWTTNEYTYGTGGYTEHDLYCHGMLYNPLK